MGGALAYWYLKDHSPESIARVVSILEKHPWFSTEWKSRLEGISMEEKEVRLFMLASTFPDEARRTPFGSGEKTKWHYINYQFNPTNLPVPEMVVPNAEQKLKELIGSVANEINAEQQALDLCWLFHILEDIHQPLHTTALFDPFHKKGDKGGNDTYFTFTDGAKPIRLHSFWDGLIKGVFDSIPQMARQWYLSPANSETNLKELKENPLVEDWIGKESFELAKTVVYRNGTLNGPEDSATLVPQSYKAEAVEVAERRVLLSGIRLGKKLAELFGKV